MTATEMQVMLTTEERDELAELLERTLQEVRVEE
jgi:truncated hemoglobin YjbI